MTPVERVLGCETCLDRVTPNFWGACSSVGIEHGASTANVALLYLLGYHKRGHRLT